MYMHVHPTSNMTVKRSDEKYEPAKQPQPLAKPRRLSPGLH